MRATPTAEVLDEQSLAEAVPPVRRRERGVYFTPQWVVRLIFERLRPLLPARGSVAVVDPSCGAGAFLAHARTALPRASLYGLELDDGLARRCRSRLPAARIRAGDALRGELDRLVSPPPGAFELWVGNPPYNGTSTLLRDKAAYAALCGELLNGVALPRGTSLRDDFAFFLLRAARHLSARQGALAFITPTSLLHAYFYAPLRRALLDLLCLVEVIELGRGVFRDTRVETCVTVWRTQSTRARPARHVRATGQGSVTSSTALAPGAPDWLLRPVDAEAAKLDALWRERGEPITALVGVSLPGLKTRFDELLVDDDPERLYRRVKTFLATPPAKLPAFAAAHDIPARCWPKLAELSRLARAAGARPERTRVRPFYRYAGPRHRGVVPPSARAYCYLDRALIPRGDHRLRGAYDPHAVAPKLLFNTRELPLCAAVLEDDGCVHDYQHSRFAPLYVPERLWRDGLSSARRHDQLGPLVPNLSPRGRAWALRLGGPLAAYRALAAFVNSADVQERWAPAFGASRDLPVPVELL